MEQIEFHPPEGYRRAHGGIEPGTWSDDGAQALCLLASLQACGKLDPTDPGHRLLRWLREGYMAVDGLVFDVGNTTNKALKAIERGQDPVDAGPRGARDNGNGALMRVLPLALWHRGPDEALLTDAITQSRVTHGHSRSLLCCAVYCLWARRIIERSQDPWDDAVATVRTILCRSESAMSELDGPIAIDRGPGGEGTGYVVDCLHSARACLQAGGYEAVVRSAVALGNDTDTTAAVAGGLAGLRDGLDAIPHRWREELRGKQLLKPLLHAVRSG